LYILLGDFAFDKEVLERRANFLDFFYAAFELAARKALHHHLKMGKDVADYDFIVDLHGFTETKGACIVCLAFDAEVAGNLNSKWPKLLARLDFINGKLLYVNVFLSLSVCKEECWTHKGQHKVKSYDLQCQLNFFGQIFFFFGAYFMLRTFCLSVCKRDNSRTVSLTQGHKIYMNDLLHQM
jgi:hypothetical protein